MQEMQTLCMCCLKLQVTNLTFLTLYCNCCTITYHGGVRTAWSAGITLRWKVYVWRWGKTGVASFPSKTDAYLFTKIRVKIKWMALQENYTDCLKTQILLVFLMDLTHWLTLFCSKLFTSCSPGRRTSLSSPLEGRSFLLLWLIVTNANSEFWVTQHLSNSF